MAIISHPRCHTVVAAVGTEKDPLLLEPQLKKLPDGSLYLTWTGGGDGEPETENVVMCKRSYDNGETWTEETCLLSHPSKGMFLPTLFGKGNILYGFAGSYYATSPESTAFAQDFQSYKFKSEDGGKTFTTPRSLGNGLNGIHIKSVLDLGDRWLLACSFFTLFGHHWASYENANKPCIVNGEVIPRPEGCFFDNKPGQNSHYNRVGVLITEDEGETFRMVSCVGDPDHSFVEPAITSLSDGTLVMLLRTFENRLWETRSADGGESWSEPQPTEIPSAISKVLLLKDRTGKHYLVFNPNPAGRNPLSLWISDDDMKTWNTKVDLVSSDEENKWLCYPDGFLDEDTGVLHIAWDDRRHIYHTTYPLSITVPTDSSACR